VSEPSPATPEPLRRRRSRDRAPGGTGEDDSWAHLVGLGRPWDTDGVQGADEAPSPPAAEADTTAASSPSRDRNQGTSEPPL